jgi:hypothetical protein
VPLLFCQPAPPENAAVIVWLPPARVVVLNVATPLAFTATLEANVAAPSVNVMVPEGTPADEVTVAVKVTDCPKVEGFGADVTAVAVLFTTTFGGIRGKLALVVSTTKSSKLTE